jgi:hypothetical protein
MFLKPGCSPGARRRGGGAVGVNPTRVPTVQNGSLFLRLCTVLVKFFLSRPPPHCVALLPLRGPFSVFPDPTLFSGGQTANTDIFGFPFRAGVQMIFFFFIQGKGKTCSQCCGYGSARIRIILVTCIRIGIRIRIKRKIRIRIKIFKLDPEPDLDPHQFADVKPNVWNMSLDPDPYQGEKSDPHQLKNPNPDPHQGDKSNPDPHRANI